MARVPRLAERDVFNQLTVIKLALQLLEHGTPLSDHQRRLVDTALQATDRLGSRLLERVAEARQRALLEQAEQLQDDDDHHDRADDRQDAVATHGRSFPAAAEATWRAAGPLAAADQRMQAAYRGG